MKELVRKLFNIYPGEEKNAFQFALLGFLWSLAISLGWKNADALFLLNVGADALPASYAIIACCMIAIASGMIYAYDEFSAHRIFLTILSAAVVFYTFAYICLHFGIGINDRWLWYALRICGWILFAVANTSFWTFLDQFYHLRDSKRLFCLFSSAIFIGMAVTGIVMNSGLVEFDEITLGIIAILLLAMAWIIRIVRHIQPIHSEYDIDAPPEAPEESLRQTIAAIRRSPFTLCLMALNFMLFISMILNEFNYMSAFEEALGGNLAIPVADDEQAPLTLFLGKCIAFASAFNLFFGLFVYSRLLRRFGLGTLLLITPLLLIFTYTSWPFSPTLFFPLIAFFVSESTIFVIDDNNFNLLLNGVPSKLKTKVRIFIESFFEPVGTLVSALLLTTVTLDSWIVALTASIVLFLVSLTLRALYPKAILSNLMDNAFHFEKSPKEWLPSLSKKERRLSESRLLAILKLGNPTAQEFALEGLIDFEDPKIVDQLLSVLDHSSHKAKEIFIEKLANSPFSSDTRIIEKLLDWDQEDSTPELKATLHLYLAKQGLLAPTKALQDLKTTDPQLMSAALIALKRSSSFSSPYTTAELRTLAAQHLQELLGSDDEKAILMGLLVLTVDATEEDVNILIPYLRHESLAVARQAAKAIAELASPQAARHAGKLLSHINAQTDNELRLALLQALGKMEDTSLVYDILDQSVFLRPNERRQIEKTVFKMGLRNVPTLLNILKDITSHDRSRLLAGKVLGRLALPQLRANLIPIITAEIERAFFYFYHYHTIQETYPQFDLHILKDALLSSYHSVMDFIIQLLGVSGEVEDSEVLSRSMRSNNPKVRSQVIETLEKTCDTPLFRLLQGLVDEVPLSVKLRAFPKPTLSLEQLLMHLSASSSLVDQIAAAAVSSTLQLPHWRETLKQQMQGKGEIFNQFAYDILET